MSRDYNRKELTEFEKILEEVMDKVYEGKEFPKKADYEKAVIDKYNEKFRCHFKYREVFHAQIWGAIQHLIKLEKMKQIDNYVIPMTVTGKKIGAIYAIKRYLSFQQSSVHRISENTIAIALSEDTNINRACRLFKDYFEEDHCYSIVKMDTTIIIMLHNYESEDDKESTDKEDIEIKDVKKNKDAKDIDNKNDNDQDVKNTNAMDRAITKLNKIIKEKYDKDMEMKKKYDPFKEARARERAKNRAVKRAAEEVARLQETKGIEQVNTVNENNNKD